MKKEKIAAIILAFSAIVFGCNKERFDEEAPRHFGNASAYINGDSTSFEVSVRRLQTNDTLYSLGFHYYINGARRKFIYFTGFRMVNERQFLNSAIHMPNRYPFSSYATYLLDGDVAGNYYYLNEDDSIEDYLEITYFNLITKEVRGLVQGSYFIAPELTEKQDLASPDTIIVTKGIFKTKIFD